MRDGELSKGMGEEKVNEGRNTNDISAQHKSIDPYKTLQYKHTAAQDDMVYLLVRLFKEPFEHDCMGTKITRWFLHVKLYLKKKAYKLIMMDKKHCHIACQRV